MDHSWIILAVLAGFASNLYNFFNRYLLKEGDDATSYAWLVELIRLIIAFSVIRFDYSINNSNRAIFLLLLLSLIELVSVYVFMKMHAFSHLSVSTIIQRTRLVWIPMLAFIFLQETLKGIEYLGIIAIFLGLSVAVSPRKLVFDKGMKYAYLSAFIVAILSIVMKELSLLVSTSLLLIGMSATSVVLFPILMKNQNQRLLATFKNKIHLKIIAGTANTIAMYLYVLALKEGSVSQVTAIYQGMMIVSILAGIILLREREDILKKSVGAAITLGGAMLLTYF